jgi:hypothetical protein
MSEASVEITVYLPDPVGERAKAEGINLSGALRAAVEAELRMTEAMERLASSALTVDIELENSNGDRYLGRITGTLLARGRDCAVYVTDNERIVLYDEVRLAYYNLDDPEEELKKWLDEDDYLTACNELGIKPVLNL